MRSVWALEVKLHKFYTSTPDMRSVIQLPIQPLFLQAKSPKDNPNMVAKRKMRAS
jgi:hypothetical protein